MSDAVSQWSDPATIAALAAAFIAIGNWIRSERGRRDVKAQVQAVADHTAAAAVKAADTAQTADLKLDAIAATTGEMKVNTDGHFTRLLDRDLARSEREKVLERMLSETTTILNARVSGASAQTVPTGRRRDDPPLHVKIVDETATKKDAKE